MWKGHRRFLWSIVATFCSETAYGFSARLPPPRSASVQEGLSGSSEGKFRFMLHSNSKRRQGQRSVIERGNAQSEKEESSFEEDGNKILQIGRDSFSPQEHFQVADAETLQDLSPVEGAALPTQSTETDSAMASKDSIQFYLSPLLSMCRLANLPGVLVFHVVGARAALRQQASISGTSFHLFSILAHPGMLVTLATIVLVTTTSMAVNSYYDARSGVDTDHSNPIVAGIVPPHIAKRFLAYVYALLAVAEAFVPGWPARIFVVLGGFGSFYYTNYIKPMIWWKNAFCAGLIASGQLTSGVAALHIANGGSVSPISEIQTTLTALWMPVLVFFLGVMGREIAMDIDDAEGDARAGIQTVPVFHGKRFASRTVLALSIASVLVAGAGPGLSLLQSSSVWPTAFRSAIDSGWSIPSAIGSTFQSFLSTPDAKRLALVLLGGGLYVNAACSVASTEGEDSSATQRVISRSMIGALMIWASFI